MTPLDAELPLAAIREAPELQPVPEEPDPDATEEAMAALPQDLEMATWQGADAGALLKAMRKQQQKRREDWTAHDEAVLVRIYREHLGDDWYTKVGGGKHHKKVQAMVEAATGRTKGVRQKVNRMAKAYQKEAAEAAAKAAAEAEAAEAEAAETDAKAAN